MVPLDIYQAVWDENLGTQLLWGTFLEVPPSRPPQHFPGANLSYLGFPQSSLGASSWRLLVPLCVPKIPVAWGLWLGEKKQLLFLALCLSWETLSELGSENSQGCALFLRTAP